MRRVWLSWAARCVAGVALMTMAVGPVAAQASRPVPEVAVAAPGGAMVPLTSLGGEQPWLILYMGAPGSAASLRLLQAMESWALGGALSRVVVVVATAADAQPLASEWATRLPGVRWAGDPDNAMAKALGVRGAPTLLGIKGGAVDWVLAGVLNDPTMLRDVVKSWIDAP